MSGGLSILAILAANVAAALQPAPAVRYVAAQQVTISCDVVGNGPVEQVQLFVSTDGGATWLGEAPVSGSTAQARFCAPCDGRYDFFFVARNAGGASSADPLACTTPHVRVIVDTAPPIVQIHRYALESTAAESAAEAGATALLRVRATAVDENLGPCGTRLFYRASSADRWQDGGSVALSNGEATWSIPAEAAAQPEIHLRLLTTDLAGNQSADETTVGLSRSDGDKAATRLGSARVSAAANAGTILAVEKPVVLPAEPLRSAVFTYPDEPAPRATPLAAREAEQLRARAKEHLAEGNLSLAAARLQDVLDRSPNDVETLVQLGDALYRGGRVDEAQTRYESAAAVNADDGRAIEGLALVAATRKDYPAAGAHLQHLLRIQPDSAQTWLRYGDIEHKLGNLDAALEAWQRTVNSAREDATLRENARRRLRYFTPAQRGKEHAPRSAG